MKMEHIILVILCAFTRTMLSVEGAKYKDKTCKKPFGPSRDYWDCEADR